MLCAMPSRYEQGTVVRCLAPQAGPTKQVQVTIIRRCSSEWGLLQRRQSQRLSEQRQMRMRHRANQVWQHLLPAAKKQALFPLQKSQQH